MYTISQKPYLLNENYGRNLAITFNIYSRCQCCTGKGVHFQASEYFQTFADFFFLTTQTSCIPSVGDGYPNCNWVIYCSWTRQNRMKYTISDFLSYTYKLKIHSMYRKEKSRGLFASNLLYNKDSKMSECLLLPIPKSFSIIK